MPDLIPGSKKMDLSLISKRKSLKDEVVDAVNTFADWYAQGLGASEQGVRKGMESVGLKRSDKESYPGLPIPGMAPPKKGKGSILPFKGWREKEWDRNARNDLFDEQEKLVGLGDRKKLGLDPAPGFESKYPNDFDYLTLHYVGRKDIETLADLRKDFYSKMKERGLSFDLPSDQWDRVWRFISGYRGMKPNNLIPMNKDKK